MTDAMQLSVGDLDRPWHALSRSDVADDFGTDADRGLDEDEVRSRREEFGPNSLPERGRTTLFGTVLRQFRDPLITILLVAGSVSLAIGEVQDAIFIAVVLILNAGLGTFQEYRAESAAQELEEVITVAAVVVRAGSRTEVDSEEIVPGDLVRMEAGASVPADIRLLESQELRVDESLLTGESTPVDKDAGAELEDETPLGDRSTLLHAGSRVLSGTGTGVVVRTAESTELGTIADSLAEEPQDPPLVLRMRRFTRIIAMGIGVVIIVLGLVQALRGEALVDIFLLAVALAVSAIPAGLPIAVTVALSLGSNRMAERNVIVRRLPAVEGLGACTLIASDKTGTLTENELTATRIVAPDGDAVDISGAGLDLSGEATRDGEPVDSDGWLADLAVTGALSSEGEVKSEDGETTATGDTVDVAFLVLGHKLGIDRAELVGEHPRVGHIPFSSSRRFAASFHEHDDGIVAHVKGAAQAVVDMCAEVDADELLAREEELAGDGFRVIAVAAGQVQMETEGEPDPEVLTDLRFLGLVGLIDPVREAVPDAIDRCHSAGVDVRMVTGDHPATAMAIAREINIAAGDDDVVVGSDIGESRAEEGSEDAAHQSDELIRDRHVYARVEPQQKTTIVDSLQRSGHFVAVTGDGVNDAPALNAAHIGVAMGKSGTDVARGAADLILTDDNFASIVDGIEEGRRAYDNVRKVVWLLITTAVAELVLFILSVTFDMALPLTPVQLLWLNLVTNGIQDVALAFEKGEPDLLKRRPRPPTERIFNRRMIEQVAVSGIYMGLVAFGVFWVLTEQMGMETDEARNLLLLLLVLFENVLALNVRSETRSLFRIPLLDNRVLIGGVVVSQAVHIASMFIPGWRDVLGVEPVAFGTWALLLALTVTLVGVIEAVKFRSRRLAHELA
ncbi:cation-translocating P-type ATPase [Demequina sp. SO4-13]|uniref:cation-translocating P-type ATPase n=1 Tax=Demequina sp. SO4-13 TaxID=3401027 RepID=UPI003AF6FD78